MLNDSELYQLLSIISKFTSTVVQYRFFTKTILKIQTLKLKLKATKVNTPVYKNHLCVLINVMHEKSETS